MPTYEEVLAAVTAELDAWLAQQKQRIQAEGDAHMAALREKARASLQDGLKQAEAAYRQSIADIVKIREDGRRKSPEVAKHMEKTWTMLEEAAKRDLDMNIAFLKDMYRKGMGIT